MKVVFKAIVLVSTVCFFIFLSATLQIFFRSPRKRRYIGARATRFVAPMVLKAMRVRLEISPKEARPLPGHLIVSNHLSYIDVFAISMLYPCVFVTSVEVREDWFLGTLCRLGGCYFVERRSRSQIREELQKIGDILREGNTVVIFPEGTTSNGDSVLPFKSSLLEAAIKYQVEILPLCLSYHRVNDQPTNTTKFRDSVFWYGDMGFLPHFFRLLALNTIDLKVSVLPLVKPDPAKSRKQISDGTRSTILSCYQSHLKA